MIAIEEHDAVATIWLDNRARLNALPLDGWEWLGEVVHGLGERSDLVAVVVRGRGGRAFCAGIDLHDLGGRSSTQVSRVLIVVEETLLRIEHLPMPTIAVVRGWALGAGCELAMACDLRVAEVGAAIGLPVARFGLMAHNRLVKRAVDYLGPGLVKEMLFTGRSLSGEEASDAGLVNRVVAPEEVDAVLAEWLARLRQSSPAVLRAAKRAVALGAPLPVSYGTDAGAPSYFVDGAHFQTAVARFRTRHAPLGEGGA